MRVGGVFSPGQRVCLLGSPADSSKIRLRASRAQAERDRVAVGTGGAGRFVNRWLILGQDAGQLLDCTGQIVQPAVRVAGCQGRSRMTSQLLQGPQIDAGAPAKGQVAVPESL